MEGNLRKRTRTIETARTEHEQRKIEDGTEVHSKWRTLQRQLKLAAAAAEAGTEYGHDYISWKRKVKPFVSREETEEMGAIYIVISISPTHPQPPPDRPPPRNQSLPQAQPTLFL